jgi:hypothetical protein
MDHGDAGRAQFVDQLPRIAAQFVSQREHGQMRAAHRNMHATRRLCFQFVRLCL